MAGTPSRTMVPFSEIFRITGNDTTNVDIWSIPAGTMIERVMSITVTAGVGASNIIVGDDDDDNGYVIAADATAAAGTIYGDDHTELGAYLYDGTKKFGLVKVYAAAGKTLKAVMSGAQSTDGVYDIVVIGHRYSV